MEDKSKSNNVKIIVIQVIIAIIISVILSFTFSLGIVSGINTEITLENFKIESFNMETEKNTYTYSEDTVSYSGKGVISCTDASTNYLVLIQEINKSSLETNYITVIVHNGTGSFSTYDSSYLGTTEKPEYEFNIIGFKTFNE